MKNSVHKIACPDLDIGRIIADFRIVLDKASRCLYLA